MSERTFLFVCTGNTCRSPLAEALLRHALGEDSNVTVLSAGVSAGDGQPANPKTLKVLTEVGIDLSTHRSRYTSPELIDSATWIVAMTTNHRDALLHLSPQAKDRTFLLTEFIPDAKFKDVPDPIGMDHDAYLQTRDVIVEAIPGILKKIQSTES